MKQKAGIKQVKGEVSHERGEAGREEIRQANYLVRAVGALTEEADAAMTESPQ